MGATVRVLEAERTRPGTVVPIGELEEVPRPEVSVEGTVETLWEAALPAIFQVGLLKDETGTTKVTLWRRSKPRAVAESEHVRIRGAAKNWYNGRVSLAVTGSSIVTVPDLPRR